jgi:maleylacetate reductase
LSDLASPMTYGGSFVVSAMPTRLVFGPGSRHTVGDELDRAGIGRVLLLSTPRERGPVEAIAASFADRVAGHFDGARMHVPHDVAEAALAAARECGADGALAVGGGSTTGLAKALALSAGLPYVAVPTTFAGSEMTSIWGMTTEGRKRTGRDERVRPRTAVYDAELVTTLPVELAVASGLNAVAHAAEALYAPDRSPLIETIAVEAVRALVPALRRVADDPEDVENRAAALYGASMCGVCLSATQMSLHHKICHVLGGSFDLLHAETHATVLPYVLAYNLPVTPAAEEALKAALGSLDPISDLWALSRLTSAHGSLADLGMRREDIDKAADLILEHLGRPQANPRPVDRDSLRTILTAAWEGGRPDRELVPFSTSGAVPHGR